MLLPIIKYIYIMNSQIIKSSEESLNLYFKVQAR